MNLADIPAKYQTVWAVSAAGGYIRTPPQSPSGQPGAADWEQGFPPLTFTQVAAGGSPPFGQDFNGLLQLITAWGQWAQAGGAQPFDATFAGQIGGYPRTAVIPAASQAGVWYNLADGNEENPDTGGSNWVLIGPGMEIGALGGDLTGTIADAIIRDGVIVDAMMVANTLTGASIEQAPAAGFFGALAPGNGGWISGAQAATIIGPKLVIQAQNQQASGTGSGETLSGTTTRVLNTLVVNTIPGASLSGNEVHLPTGSYRVSAQACSQADASITNYVHKIVFHNDDDNVVLVNGTNAGYAGGANNCVVNASLAGFFTLTAPKGCSLLSFVSAACDGGPATHSAWPEVYCNVEIETL